MSRFHRVEILPHFFLVVLVTGVAMGLAFAFRSWLPWLFLVPCVVSLFWRFERAPAWFAGGARYAALTLVLVAAAIVRFFPTNQIFSPRASTQLTEFVSYSLLAYSVLFLLGPGVWRPGTTLFPAALAALAIAAMNKPVDLSAPVMISGCAGFAYLVSTALARPAQRLPRDSASPWAFRVGVNALAVFVIAWGIIAFLPWAQVQFEQAAFRFFSMGVTQYSSLSLESRLGDIEQLLVSSKLVMRVYTSRPQKLRGRIFTDFDGRFWRARPVFGRHLESASASIVTDAGLRDWLVEISGSSYAIPPFNPVEVSAPDVIRTRIVQSVFNEGLLVAPGHKLLARVPLSSLRLDAFEGIDTPLSSDVEIYGIVNRREADSWGEAVVQPGEVAAPVLQELLALPANTDPRFRELAARLATGSPEERLRRTVSYVQGAATYSLRLGKFHTEQPAAEFLFEKKRGFCQYFATAAAILLRLEGMPTRYVTGFNVGEGNLEGGHYVVRERDAHAWIEAYIPGRGWIEADPTPEAEYDALHAGATNSWLASAQEFLAAKWAELAIRFRQGDLLGTARWVWREIKALASALSWKALGIAIVLIALVALVLRLVLRRGRRPAASRAAESAGAIADGIAPELAALLDRLDRAWARCGVRRPPTAAPLEHLSSIAPEKISPALREASRRAVECYYATRYAGLHVAPTEIELLQKQLERQS